MAMLLAALIIELMVFNRSEGRNDSLKHTLVKNKLRSRFIKKHFFEMFLPNLRVRS